MPIGIESSHNFGDVCFNLPLIKAIHEKHQKPVWVASKSHCKDALLNIPWVDKIIETKQMGQGISRLYNLSCDPVFQITQNIKFFEFRKHDPKHSLIDTPLHTGRQLGLPDFDQRPIFIPTEFELAKTRSIKSDQPTIGIETVYKSAQSWAEQHAFQMILDQYLPTHRILWLSNEGAPKHEHVDDLLRFNRREVIMCLQACDIFFSVGSGFFCASMALPAAYQPKKIVCLWTDLLYRYEEPLNKHKWHPDIIWVHNHNELDRCLNKLQQS